MHAQGPVGPTCGACGAPHGPSSRFCVRCGAPLVAPAPAAPPPGPEPGRGRLVAAVAAVAVAAVVAGVALGVLLARDGDEVASGDATTTSLAPPPTAAPTTAPPPSTAPATAPATAAPTAPPPTPTAPPPPAPVVDPGFPLGTWVTVRVSVRDAASAREFRDEQVPGGAVLRTDDYPSLTPGHWIVVLGPHRTGEQAVQQCWDLGIFDRDDCFGAPLSTSVADRDLRVYPD